MTAIDIFDDSFNPCLLSKGDLFDPDSVECSGCPSIEECLEINLEKMFELLEVVKKVCVISDPRSGSQCPAHHNCSICEFFKRY